MASLIPRLLGFLCFCSVCIGLCWCQDQDRPFVISSFTLPEVWLKPYDYTYLRVEIPPWFSSVVLMFVSQVEIDKFDMKKFSKSNLPLVCFKDGSPPIPDISDSFLDSSLSNFLVNGSTGGTQETRAEQCIPFQKNLTMALSNEQISPGVWYFGFFNGLGPARTQSKMISRGRSYMFRANIMVQGCPISTIWGRYCNQSIDMVSCSQSSVSKNSSLPDINIYKNNNLKYSVTKRGHLGANYHLSKDSKHSTIQGKQVVSNSSIFTRAENMITCKDPIESSCVRYGDFKLYFLDVVNVASQFTITATDFKFNQTSSMNNAAVPDGILLMCYARYNAMPLSSLHDHSADISSTPLIVKSPKIGRWYVSVQAVNQTKETTKMQESYFEGTLCFSFEWKLHECVNGKAGLNCLWEAHMLQRVPRRGGSTSESFYLPIDKNVLMEIDDDEFPLDGLLSNSSSQNSTWTYFFLDIPHGAAGTNMHIQLESEMKLTYEVYSKYGGLASTDSWDYYANSTSSSNGSAILTLDDSSDGKINFYILYAREGLWCFGLKHPPATYRKELTTMSISIVGCPKHCSSHGRCHYTWDESGLSFYSYCACDRDHGGFDCSTELVSHKGHIWQSIFLVASNAAAILPAFLALRRKAFAEWVLFTSSGISSGLYHACDVGTWCALSFHVLQFMDFWLSFMAVVSTFVYMSTIGEASKRAIHTAVAIITALLAETGATRSENIVIVIAIGMLGLFIAWLVELSTSYRPTYCAQGWNLNMNDRWLNIKRWFWNFINILHKRFCWRLVVLGFITLAVAATSWTLENNKSYWIWHSLWHITIYTSSFFFLWSTSVKSSDEPQPEVAYELTRQDSSRID